MEKRQHSVTFASRLRAMMDERNLTQKQVADAIGVARSSVMNWLHGTFPGSRELFLLSKYVGCPMEWFFEVITSASAHEPNPHLDTPVDQMSPGMRHATEAVLAMLDDPAHVTIEAKAGEKPKIHRLTDDTLKGSVVGVKTEISGLLQRVSLATAQRGKKAELARYLDVAEPRIFEWLSGRKEPGGETTLRLLKWVERQEEKLTSPGSVSPLPGPKTRLQQSSHEEPKPSQPE